MKKTIAFVLVIAFIGILIFLVQKQKNNYKNIEDSNAKKEVFSGNDPDVSSGSLEFFNYVLADYTSDEIQDLSKVEVAREKLTANLWGWVGSTLVDAGNDPATNFLLADEPAQYLLIFSTEGKFTFETRCAVIEGEYTLGEGQKISFDATFETKKECPKDEITPLVTAYLESADNFAISTRGTLNISSYEDLDGDFLKLGYNFFISVPNYVRP